MKKIITFFFCIISVVNYAQLQKYSFNRKLNTVYKESYYSISLLPEITSHCRSGYNDIRIYSINQSDTLEIPYTLEFENEKKIQSSIEFSILNQSFVPNNYSVFTIKSLSKQNINQLILEFAETDFDKNLILEGSNNNTQWLTIAEHLRVVKFTNEITNYVYTTLNFNNTDYNYLRIKLNDKNSKRINLVNAIVSKTGVVEGKYDELKIKKRNDKENKKDKTTEIIIDFENYNHINYITLNTQTTKDFYRNVNVYVSSGTYKTPKGEKEIWSLLTTSVLTSLENNKINCNNEFISKLKIEVQNNDNQPIWISEIKAYSEKCRLIADLPASENIYLAYGRVNDDEPIYDLEHFKEKIPKLFTAISYGNELTKAVVSKANKSMFMENKKWLWIAMGATILIIFIFALRMLKKEQE